MENTEHYNLNLPDGEDIYNINDFNQNTEKIDDLIYDIEEDIADMKVTFRAGVDSIYDACVGKGSTPASHALVDVVTAIENISGGGGADIYSMFPQWVLGYIYGGCACDYHDYLSDGDNVIVADIIPLTDNSSITMNFSMNISTYYAGTVTFSLIIDNDTIIPNVASITLDEHEHRVVSFSYSFDTPLSPEYHVIALRANMSSGMYSASIMLPLCNFYGTDFIGAAYPGGYLVNGEFVYFTPNNFVIPTNPTVYELASEDEPGGCVAIEDFADAMNNHFPSSFDSGNSFHLQGISGYWDYDSHGEEPEYIVPDIEDTLAYSNGKIIYNHPTSRSIITTYGCETWVQEKHSLLLPIVGKFFKLFDYINIHCKLTSRISPSEDSHMHGYVSILVLDRINQNTVEYSYNGYQSEYQPIEYLSVNEEFTVSVCVDDIDNNGINFIGVYFYEVDSNSDPFTVEIDKIWGSNIDLTN